MTARLLAALMPLTLVAAAPVASTVVSSSIPLTDGGWDYASIDAATNTLYLARTDGIDAVNLTTKAVRRLATADRAHEVMAVPGTNMVLETDGTSNSVRIFDRNSGALLKTIAVGEKPDAAIWDPGRKRAIVINAKSGSISVVDPVAATVTITVQLEPSLEFAAIDGKGRLFVNNEATNKMTAVDLNTGKRIADIDMPGCEGPTGLTYAAWADKMVASCETVTAIVDPGTLKFVEALPTGTGPDAVIADPAHHRLFVPAGGSGDLSVIESRGGKLIVSRRIPTMKSARTGAYDARLNVVYLPVASFSAPVPPARRGALVPGSVGLLVVTP